MYFGHSPEIKKQFPRIVSGAIFVDAIHPAVDAEPYLNPWYQNARSRLASYLIDHIVETDDDEATVRLDLPRHVVASRLSITPETLSRLLRAMSDDGILTVDDRLVFVHSLARLRPYD